MFAKNLLLHIIKVVDTFEPAGLKSSTGMLEHSGTKADEQSAGPRWKPEFGGQSLLAANFTPVDFWGRVTIGNQSIWRRVNTDDTIQEDFIVLDTMILW